MWSNHRQVTRGNVGAVYFNASIHVALGMFERQVHNTRLETTGSAGRLGAEMRYMTEIDGMEELRRRLCETHLLVFYLQKVY